MMKKAIIFGCMLIAGCATIPTTENYEKVLNTWVGSSVDNLVSSWGPPMRSYNLSNGGQVIEYSNSRNAQIGGYAYTQPETTYNYGTASAYGNNGNSAYGSYSGTTTRYVQKQRPTYNVTLTCTTRFTINSYGKVEKWNWQGNSCKALPPK